VRLENSRQGMNKASDSTRVRAGLMSVPWEYEWSSCRAYALGASDPLLSYNVWYRDSPATLPLCIAGVKVSENAVIPALRNVRPLGLHIYGIQ
jgi:hypothetical protein